jgi:hypothetical protein
MLEDLTYIINHIFLPPKLPLKDDSDDAQSIHLIEEVLEALRSFQDHIQEQERSEWIPCIKMVGNILQTRDHCAGLVAEKVGTTLRRMIEGGEVEPTIDKDDRCLILFALV